MVFPLIFQQKTCPKNLPLTYCQKKKKSKGQSYYENLNVVILLANHQPCKRPLARKKKLMSFLLNCLLLQRPHVDIPNACTVAAKWTWDGQKRVFLVQQCLSHFQWRTFTPHSTNDTDWMSKLHVWFEHFSHLYHPRSKWLWLTSVCNEVDCTGAYVEPCEVAILMCIWILFNISVGCC